MTFLETCFLYLTLYRINKKSQQVHCTSAFGLRADALAYEVLDLQGLLYSSGAFTVVAVANCNDYDDAANPSNVNP